jgi:hypothetical protein
MGRRHADATALSAMRLEQPAYDKWISVHFGE